MKLRFFDFEVYKHWWTCGFGDLPEDIETVEQLREREDELKKTFVSVRSDRGNPRDELMKLLREENVCCPGYNIKKYDNYIANAVYQGFDPDCVAIVNDFLIHKNKQPQNSEEKRMAIFANRRLNSFVYLDLFDSSTGSLKDKEAILGLSVKETTVPFDKENLTEEDKDDIILYNFHDIYSSMYWYINTVKPFIETKLILCRTKNIPIEYGYKDTNAGLSSRALGVKRQSFDDAEEVKIYLPTKIKKYCEDNLPKNILDHVLNKTSVLNVDMCNNKFVFADGGIHSTYDVSEYKRKDSPVLYVKSDDEWTLLNVDAGSFYPSIMIQLGTLSRCVTNPQVFIDIFNERLAIKHKANKTKLDDDIQLADKLILNTTYGASGAKWLDLYDPYQRTRTCRFGQLFLAALACKLYKTIDGLQIIQTNTDGILVYCRRKDIDKVKALMDEWHKMSGITMEEDYVDAIWQRDVNNYVMVKAGGKVKVKGAWLNHTIIRPGYIMIAPRTAYVSARAVCDYLIHGKDIIKSIVNNNDIMDFAITTTKGPTFNRVIYRYANGMEIPTYNYNRVIASKDQKLGQVYKVKDDSNGVAHYTVASSTPEHSLLINDDVKTYDFNELKKEIDYMYYVQNAAERMEGTWLQLDSSGLFPTNQFNYFDNQNDFNI